jgi:(p)ppGpp synthase/HD superfamily hydrolase
MINNRTTALFGFVSECHFGQERKYTGEPYTNHLKNVAETVWTHTKSELLVGLAYCHDLFEDTNCTKEELFKNLLLLGFPYSTATLIASGTTHLTDVYTNEAYPDKNRKWRKQMEAKRLWRIPHWAQTVKYADFIDNTSSIVQHDPNFAKTYLEEKRFILSNMRKGEENLLVKAESLINVI